MVITMHQHPDGDALSASLAMAHLCQKKGHCVDIIAPNGYPNFLGWVPGIDSITIFSPAHEEKIQRAFESAEIIFCLDFIPLHRAGELAPLIKKSNAFKIAIDHHPDEGEKMDIMINDLNAAATCSMLYDLLFEIGEEALIDKRMATYLYLGILTDTGCFRHSNTSAAIHKKAAYLLDKGLDGNQIYQAIYGQQSIDRLRFIANAIMKRLFIKKEKDAAFFAIPSRDFKRFKMRPGDKAGIVNYALDLAGVRLAGLLVEQYKGGKKQVTISFRSIGDISVNDIAWHYFKGGGHKHAAGAISSLPLEKVVERFEKLIEDVMPAGKIPKK